LQQQQGTPCSGATPTCSAGSCVGPACGGDAGPCATGCCNGTTCVASSNTTCLGFDTDQCVDCTQSNPRGAVCTANGCGCNSGSDCTSSPNGTVCAIGPLYCGCNSLSDCTGAAAYPGGCCGPLPIAPGALGACVPYGWYRVGGGGYVCKNGNWPSWGQVGTPCEPVNNPCTLNCCDMTQTTQGYNGYLYGVCANYPSCSGGQCGSRGSQCCGGNCAQGLTCQAGTCN
jgi:hypothetical protein